MSTINRLVLYALCSALVVISKEMLAFLPNIELVTFLLIMYSLHFPLKGTLLIAIVFCFLQVLLYGIGLWTPMYFIVWPALVFITYSMRKYLINYHRCAIWSALFGLCFGFLFSIPYFIISIQTGWIYFVKGIFFDIIHCIGNYIIMIVLFDRLQHTFKILSDKFSLHNIKTKVS